MLPTGAALGLGVPGFHERIKQEEEHRARLARQEEEREREMQQREKERELREQREREQREKEAREKEQREREQREKEQREKEAREREMREKEREAARERERLHTAASHHYPPQMYTHPSMRNMPHNLLGQLLPPGPSGLASLTMGLRPPPQSSLHSISQLSPYHTSSQRQSPHAAMSLNLGMGLPPMPPHSVHSSLNLSHHLPLGHPSAVPVTHPSLHPSAAALGVVPTSLALAAHPSLLAHQAASGSLNLSSTGSPGGALNLGASQHSVNLTVDRDQQQRERSAGVYGGYSMPVSTSSGPMPRSSSAIPAVTSAQQTAGHYPPPARPSSQPQSVNNNSVMTSSSLTIPKSPQMAPVTTPNNCTPSATAGIMGKQTPVGDCPPGGNGDSGQTTPTAQPAGNPVENGANSSSDEMSGKEGENGSGGGGGGGSDKEATCTSNGAEKAESQPANQLTVGDASAAAAAAAANNGETGSVRVPTPPADGVVVAKISGGTDNGSNSLEIADKAQAQQTGKDDTISIHPKSPSNPSKASPLAASENAKIPLIKTPDPPSTATPIPTDSDINTKKTANVQRETNAI